MAVDCFDAVKVLRQPDVHNSNGWSSERAAVGMINNFETANPPSSRTHQRLYERQNSVLQSVESSPTSTFASIFNANPPNPNNYTPMHSSTSSPLDNTTTDPFACWSPIAVEEKTQPTWNTGYNWMHSGSENSNASEEYNESMNGYVDGTGAPLSNSRVGAWSTAETELPIFADASMPVAANFHHPQPLRANDENVLTQMLRLSLAESHNDKAMPSQQFQAQQPTRQQQENGGLLMRKWSNETDSSDTSSLHYGQSFPQQRAEGINHRQFYAPYVNGEEQNEKSWPSLIEQYVLAGFPSSRPTQNDPSNKSTPHYIPANSEKWSTAGNDTQTQQPRVGPTDMEVRQLIAKHVRELLAEQQKFQYAQSKHSSTQQQFPMNIQRHGSFKQAPQQRQVFAPLNSSTQQPTSPIHQRPGLSCDEAELQWYHHNLELQQCVYDRIYSMILSGQMTTQNGRNAAKPVDLSQSTTVPTATQRNAFYSTATVSSPATQTNPTSPAAAPSSPPLLQRSSLERLNGYNTSIPNSYDAVSKLDQCTVQYRQLEKERKKTEAELAKHNLGKKISSSNTLPIPRLPPAPSRIDRLVVDFFREHARVITLLCRMEQLRGSTFDENLHQTMREWLDSIRLLQQRRLCERNAILNHLHGDGSYDEERESANLNEALVNLTKTAIRARSANWSALVQTLGIEDQVQQAQLQRIVALDYNCEPPEIRVRPVNT
ncbi:hypothetical protein M3Y94_00390700 [Aphelenchoides besseyi]|nr:hypothetical protein M3Y94_00390700 [Aphelenchoides besseyi]KAI6235001.1 hypothetical protein M3Y95_00005300 [Aphelenchoides besseyi]